MGYINHDFLQAREMINTGRFRQAYDFLQTIGTTNAEWYYLTGVCAMRIGYYDQGHEYINKAISMDPSNNEYRSALSNMNSFRNNYNDRSDYYNQRNRLDNGGCCNDGCCDLLCKLWCADSCCECMGGDLISCC